MHTLNNITIIGNIGAQPKIHTFSDGGKKATISVATNIGVGENQKTQWHTVVITGKGVDAIENAQKGDQLWATGWLGYRNWTDDNGINRKECEINALSFGFQPRHASNPTQSVNDAVAAHYANQPPVGATTSPYQEQQAQQQRQAQQQQRQAQQSNKSSAPKPNYSTSMSYKVSY